MSSHMAISLISGNSRVRGIVFSGLKSSSSMLSLSVRMVLFFLSSIRLRAVTYPDPVSQKNSQITGANDLIYPPEVIVSAIVIVVGGENSSISTSCTCIGRGSISKSTPSRARSYARSPSIWSALYRGGTCSVCERR